MNNIKQDEFDLWTIIKHHISAENTEKHVKLLIYYRKHFINNENNFIKTKLAMSNIVYQYHCHYSLAYINAYIRHIITLSRRLTHLLCDQAKTRNYIFITLTIQENSDWKYKYFIWIILPKTSRSRSQYKYRIQRGSGLLKIFIQSGSGLLKI